MTTASPLIFLLVVSFVFDPSKITASGNVVSDLVNDLLDNLLNKNVSVPLLELGSYDNRLTDIEVYFPGVKKTVSGSGFLGFKLKMEIPKVILTGKYNMKHLDVPGLFPLFGKGKLLINLDTINLSLEVKPIINALENKYNIKISVIKIVIKKSTVSFENLMNDPDMADFLNELISSLLPDLILVLPKEIIPKIQPLLDYYGTEIIRCIQEELNDLEKCVKEIKPPKENVLM